MKLLKMALIVICSVVYVVNAKAATETFELGYSSCTYNTVAISSTGATAVSNQVFSAALSGSTTSFPLVMYDRKKLVLQNLDSTNDLFCSVSLSSTAANGDLSLVAPSSLSATSGRMIVHGGGTWSANLSGKEPKTGRTQVPWCIANAGNPVLSIEQCR